MRRFSGGLVARRTRGPIAPGAALVAAGLLAAAAPPAGATIRPVTHDTPGAQTATNAAVVAGFPLNPTGPAFFLAIPPNGDPVGVGDAASGLAGFPRNGATFLVLSTGDATLADQPDQPGTFPSVNDGQSQPLRSYGDSAFDVSELQINYDAIGNQTAGCLGFDFRFLSEEYPAGLGAAYNDAFVAEGDNGVAWTTSGPSVLAPENFASSPFGQPLTIDSGAPVVMSPAEAAGTPYGAATGLMHAQILTPAQGNHRLQLSLLDHGDTAIDSAVFIDNVTFTTPGGTCPRGLTSLGPAPVITGPAIAATVETPTPTLTGTAGNATGDASIVAVRIYNGAVPAGAPVQALSAPRIGNTWSAQTAPLAPGQYTAQATQANAQGINGVSAPTTFTVVQPGFPGGGASSQQTPGDRDNDGIPDDQDTSDGSLPPIPGRSFDARVISGDVFIKYPPGAGPRAAVKPLKGFVALKGAANVPMGSQLDTRKGRVAVTSAADSAGTRTQTAQFYDGVFVVRQATPKKKPAKPAALITDLTLKGEPPRSECAPLKGSASAAAAKKKKRGAKSVLGGLWGSGKGKFRTNGKYSSATVRGTIWLTQDRCDGTLTTVKRGRVSVRDFKRRRTVTVKAGHSYLARAARAGKAKGRTK
jgi:hypothetical protein